MEGEKNQTSLQRADLGRYIKVLCAIIFVEQKFNLINSFKWQSALTNVYLCPLSIHASMHIFNFMFGSSNSAKKSNRFKNKQRDWHRFIFFSCVQSNVKFYLILNLTSLHKVWFLIWPWSLSFNFSIRSEIICLSCGIETEKTPLAPHPETLAHANSRAQASACWTTPPSSRPGPAQRHNPAPPSATTPWKR